MNICLVLMTQELMHRFFQGFAYDPDTFENERNCPQYQYDYEQAEIFYRKQNRPDRLHFAVMGDDHVIGDLYFKNICKGESCTLSIHMKNDLYKNKGYGTQAEKLALEFAFTKLQLNCVYASALIRNTRSRHVLQKVGFTEISRNQNYCQYECRRDKLR